MVKVIWSVIAEQLPDVFCAVKRKVTLPTMISFEPIV